MILQSSVRPRPGEDGDHLTYCRLCEAVCGLVARVENGRVIAVRPDMDNLHSRGHLCVKGPAITEVTYDPDRVLTPLKRTGGPGEFEPVSWDEALGDIADRLGGILAADGPDAFATYLGNPSAFSSLNVAYTRGFTSAAGSWKFYTAASQDTVSRGVASNLLYGSPNLYPMPDLARTDVLFMFGANPLVSHGSLVTAPRIREDLAAIAARGRVVVFDPRRTETAERFEHVAVRPNGDAWLLAGMIRTILEEDLVDAAFVAEHVSGFEPFRRAIAALEMDEIVQRSGVAGEVIADLARTFARARAAVAYGRVGICRGPFATLTNFLLDALNAITGRFGRPGGWGFGLRLNRSPAALAAARAAMPTGIGRFTTRIGGLPEVGGSLPSTMLAHDIAEPGVDRVRALLVMAGNPVLSSPDGEGLEAALGQLDLMFCLDIYVTETTRHAHYILPTTTFLERADATLGTRFMLRPHLHATREVIAPLGETRTESQIYLELAERMGLSRPLPFDLPPAARALGVEATHDAFVDVQLRVSDYGDLYGARPEGITLEKLLDEHPHGFRIPDHDLLSDSLEQIIYADGRIALWGEVVAGEFGRLAATPRARDGEILLIGRRDIRSLNSWMHNAERLVRSQRPTLRMNPADASRLEVQTGIQVSVTSKAGQITAQIEVSDEVPRGVVSYPHGWGHSAGWRRANQVGATNVNLLASAEPADQEAVSGMSFLDGIPVDIAPIKAAETLSAAPAE